MIHMYTDVPVQNIYGTPVHIECSICENKTITVVDLPVSVMLSSFILQNMVTRIKLLELRFNPYSSEQIVQFYGSQC